MPEERSDGAMCNPDRDFLRNIVNHVLAEAAEKLPVNVLNEIKNRLARAEDKYRFTIYGGEPTRLIDYLSSDDWAELVQYAANLNVEWVLLDILKTLEEAYRESCPQVAQKARKAHEEILRMRESRDAQKPVLTADMLARMLRLRGYKAEVQDDRLVIVEGSTYQARIEIVDGYLRYTICREGRAQTVEGLEAKLQKLGEI